MPKLPKKFEGSKLDRAGDKKKASRMGMPLASYEKSPADKKHDMMGQKNLNAKRRTK